MKKIVYAVLAIIIVIGIIVVATIGFNVDTIYSNHREVKIFLGKDYNIEDVNKIVKEVILDENVLITKVEKFDDMFCIKAKNISDEQVENLKQKLSEKYEITDTSNLVTVSDVPSYRIRDIVEPYKWPGLSVTVIVLIVMGSIYRKLGSVKVVLQEGIVLIIAEALLLSVIAIARVPINRLFVPACLFVYILTIIASNIELTRQLESKKSEESKKA